MCSIREQVLHAEQFAKNPHLEVVYQGKPNAINLPFGNFGWFYYWVCHIKTVSWIFNHLTEHIDWERIASEANGGSELKRPGWKGLA